ncbi:hypothetical protein [Pantoea sp. SOD02]|uniref:hypothetical protein n=1 Tax=Pantoea sp. SOD02 TaxID=2970818 RepID=UPI0021577128|nr:hypothetical protein [Pantoea sp. SOD02]UVC31027.1 hypothetical protein NR302_08810 [Pantoea sp. SOD02]
MATWFALWLLDRRKGQKRPARSQRNPASLQIGLAIHGSDALLFGLAFPDLVDNFIAALSQVRMNAHPTKIHL